jgi:hypothetical protein
MIPFELSPQVLIRKVQVSIKNPVGAASSRDHLISRLEAAPTTQIAYSFRITALPNSE